MLDGAVVLVRILTFFFSFLDSFPFHLVTVFVERLKNYKKCYFSSCSVIIWWD